MAVTAIHQPTRRGTSSVLRSAAWLAAVAVWAGVFGATYALSTKASPRSTAQSQAPSLAKGTIVPVSASAPAPAAGRSARALSVSGLRAIPAPPALAPAAIRAAAMRRAPTYHVPVYRPVTPVRSAPAPTTTTTTPTGGGPHGSGGTGGGTTTVGSSGSSGGGGIGTTPTTTTPGG